MSNNLKTRFRENTIVHALSADKFGRVHIEKFNVDGEYDAIAEIPMSEEWIDKLGIRNKAYNNFMLDVNIYNTGSPYALYMIVDNKRNFMTPIRSVGHYQSLMLDLTGMTFDTIQI